MRAEQLISRILEDEGLTGDLDEPATTLLVEWMIRRAEQLATRPDAAAAVEQLCRRGRELSRQVTTEGHSDQRTALERLLAAEPRD